VRRLELKGSRLLRGDRAEVVQWPAEAVHDAAEEPVADGHGEHRAGLLDGIALLDAGALAEQDAADLVLVQVERQTEQAARELEQLVRHRARQAGDARDPVTGLDDTPDLYPLDVG